MTVVWRHPNKMTGKFRTVLEGTMEDAGVNPPLTSDWRDPATFNDPGASPTSRHYYGEAGDWDIPLKGHGAIVGSIVVCLVRQLAIAAGLPMPGAQELLKACAQLEVELVASSKDSHLHIALDPNQKTPAIFGATD